MVSSVLLNRIAESYSLASHTLGSTLDAGGSCGFDAPADGLLLERDLSPPAAPDVPVAPYDCRCALLSAMLKVWVVTRLTKRVACVQEVALVTAFYGQSDRAV